MSLERKAMYDGLSHAAWGYFFLHFDFNLGTVSIFPRFMGFLFLLSAVGTLSGERRDLALLRPLAILLAAWNALDWLLSWGGGDVDGHILFLDLLISVAGLYFHFQFLTDMAALAEQYQPEGSNLDRWLRRCRTVYVVLTTLVALMGSLPAELLEKWGQWAAMGAALVALIVMVLVMAGLFELRRCFREMEADA